MAVSSGVARPWTVSAAVLTGCLLALEVGSLFIDMVGGNGSNPPMKSTERNQDPNKTTQMMDRWQSREVPKCKHSGDDTAAGEA